MAPRRRAPLLMRVARVLLGLLLASAALADAPREEQEQHAPPARGAPLTLTSAQQQAVGLRTEHPLPLKGAAQIEAYGTVLDPLALVADSGHMASTRAAAAAAAADAARLERLYRDDAQASLKSLQAARAQSVEAATQARAAAVSFRLQWGPLASWSAEQQRALLRALDNGQAVLLRADVPGHGAGGELDRRALVIIEGANVAATVLGPLLRTDAQSQTASWLLEVQHAPPALAPGARAPVQLHSAASSTGLLVPATALLYAEQGAYVYRQARADRRDTFQYEAVPVRALSRVGSGWLVEGLAAADEVVVQGAGVLWSLQGISGFSAAEEEHD
jgi:hypothetical protein